MKPFLVLALLGFALAFGVAGCDYGYAEGEDPSQVDESWGMEEYGLRVDDEAEGERLEPVSLPAAPGVPLSVRYVQVPNPSSSGSLPVQHPDPKPWKK
jgi:hypothetical protein